MNSKGLAPHPNLTKWLEKGIELAIKNKFLYKKIADVSHLAPIPPSEVTLVSD